MVSVYGVCLWCLSMVSVYGVCLWCLSMVSVYGVYVDGSDRTQHTLVGDTGDTLRGAFLGGIEHENGSFAEALVSPQREALAGLAVAGAAGLDALLALSLTKARFVGRDSMKLDRAEEVMIAV
jgi:hypothetical protein